MHARRHLACAPSRLAVVARLRLLPMVLGAAALAPLQAAPLAEPANLPRGSDASTAAGSTLDRTLQVDTDAAQRNLELLLETRGDGDPGQQPGARRPVPAAVAASASLRSIEQGQRPPPEHRADNRLIDKETLRSVVLFLREHRLLLIGGLGVAAVVVLAARAWQRWRAGAQARRLRVLSSQQRSPGERRRSSRR
jgi:hypothetical protein